jgi:prepilin-type N-terminal cleavage/methylation domain-containing protein
MRPTNQPTAAFSLVELLIVVAVMGILVGIVLPHFQPPLSEQLRGAASIVGADLSYARNLAVTNGSTYRVSFDVDGNRYVLTHTGSNPTLDTLPATPFRPSQDAPDEHTCDLDELPHIGTTVHVYAVNEGIGSWKPIGDVEFGPLGGTSRAEPTMVWLRCGSGPGRRFLPLTVDPVTGLVAVGEIQARDPATAYDVAQATSPI